MLSTSAMAEPYDVCLVNRDRKNDLAWPRRWVAALAATLGQLQEYWDAQDAKAFVPAQSATRDLTSTSCKTHKEGGNATRRARRRGWLYGCTPEGYILHLKEYVGAESLPHRYFFLAELLKENKDIVIAVHDDACHLRRYADARTSDSIAARWLAFPAVQYITDRLHARGHADPWCLANCSPQAECNRDAVAGVNTQVCEQLFSDLGRHKLVSRIMDELTGAFLLHELAEVRNEEWLSRPQAGKRQRTNRPSCSADRQDVI